MVFTLLRSGVRTPRHRAAGRCEQGGVMSSFWQQQGLETWQLLLLSCCYSCAYC